MSGFQDLKDSFDQVPAVIRDLEEQRPESEYEEELQRQRKLLDVILIPEIKLHRTDVQLLMVKKEELPPKQQERSPYPDQEQNESPLIKEEEEEVWISQKREQLQGLEEADTKFQITLVDVKSENDDEEKPESSLLHQRLTEHMETAAGGEDCGRAEPARSSDPRRHLQAEIEVQTKASSDSRLKTEDEGDDWEETRDCPKRLNSATDKRAETVTSNNYPEPDKTNHMVSPTEIRLFSCSECGKGFKRKVDLGRHMFVHTKEKPFSCSDCGKRFNQRGSLNAHLFVHTKEKFYSCSECGKKFTFRGKLTRHMSVHLKEKPFSCSECGKGFNRKESLTAHMFVHSKENPHSCSECGKRFNYKANLNVHMLIHTKEKPHSCSECGQSFKQKGQLKRHMSVHSKEKLFRCSFCWKGFNRVEHLASHVSIHSKEKPFNCTECGKGFKNEKNRISHMIVHSKEKPYCCSQCGKGFYHKASLRVHEQSCIKCSVRFSPEAEFGTSNGESQLGETSSAALNEADCPCD